MSELCGLCECMKGRCGLHVVVWWPCVSCEGGAGSMWWPWWPWDACGLPMGSVCVVREVQITCGGHGGHGCMWTTYRLCVCCEGGAGCMWWPWGACGLPMGCV